MKYNEQDLILALIGGVIIGIATSVHYLLKGRVTGFSGIFFSLITYEVNSFYWKLNLMASVVLASSTIYYLHGTSPLMSGASDAFDSVRQLSQIGFLAAGIAGFLVGVGTKLGNGCTSGHGVCGLPRLSQRSFVAVATFMATGIIAASVKNQFIHDEVSFSMETNNQIPAISIAIASTLIFVGYIGHYKVNQFMVSDSLVATLVGLLFGTGLVVSGMVKRTKIMAFLTVNDNNWDPSLAFVMIGAVCFNFISFRLLQKPILADGFDLPKLTTIDWKLVLGAALFGVGWGIGGLCPGPAIALYPEFTPQIGLLFMASLALGQFIVSKVI